MAAFAALLAGLVAAYESLGSLFPVLLLLVGLDIVTGVQAAFVLKQLSSKTSWAGINKKLMMLLAVIMAQVLEPVVQVPILSDIVAGAYCLTESLSILENMSRAGVPVPGPLRSALLDWKERSLPDRRAPVVVPPVNVTVQSAPIETKTTAPVAPAPTVDEGARHD